MGDGRWLVRKNMDPLFGIPLLWFSAIEDEKGQDLYCSFLSFYTPKSSLIKV
jgi:hypothetical protein